MHGVDQLVEVAAQVAHLLARLAQLLLATGAPLLDAGPLGGGQGHGLLEPGQHERGATTDGLADASLVEQLLTAGDRCRPGLALGLGGPEQGVRATVQGAGPLLGRAQGQPGVHLGGPRDTRLLGEALAVGGVGLLLGRVLRGREARLELGEALEVLVAGDAGGLDGLVEPGGLGPGVAGLRAVLAQLLGDGRQGGVGLVQLGERHVGPPPGLLALALQGAGVEGEPLQGVRRGAELLGGLVDRGLHLDQAGAAGGAAGGEVGADQVALAGDGGQVGGLPDGRPRGGEVVDDHDLVQQPGHGGAQVGAALDDVHGVRRTGRQARPRRRARLVGRAPAEQDPRPAEVVVLEVGDGSDGRVDVADGDRVGGVAERSRDGCLVAGAHAQQRRHRAEQPAERVGGGQQGAGAVLAVQAELERLLAGGERAALALGRR